MTDVGLLRALHLPGQPLVLPNAWDVGSAEAVVAAGFPAVATSSLAVAEALGYQDGEWLPVAELFAVLAEIVRAVPVPVTADLERGFGLEGAELVERMAEAGVVGCNLEDSDPRTEVLVEPERQADLLAAVRDSARSQGWDVVLNARVDAAMNGVGPAEQRLADCIARATVYAAAGADCVYPILLAHGMDAFVREVGVPVNAYCARASELPGLAASGVARISFGPGIWRTPAAERPALLAAIRAAPSVQ